MGVVVEAELVGDGQQEGVRCGDGLVLPELLDEAVRLAGDERVRVWRLYLRAARRGFESGFTSVYQVRCSRPASG